MKPCDGQAELLEDPEVGADDVARAIVTLERFVQSGLVTEASADDMLATVRGKEPSR